MSIAELSAGGVVLCRTNAGRGKVSLNIDGNEFFITVEDQSSRHIIMLRDRETVAMLRDFCDLWLKR